MSTKKRKGEGNVPWASEKGKKKASPSLHTPTKEGKIRGASGRKEVFLKKKRPNFPLSPSLFLENVGKALTKEKKKDEEGGEPFYVRKNLQYVISEEKTALETVVLEEGKGKRKGRIYSGRFLTGEKKKKVGPSLAVFPQEDA